MHRAALAEERRLRTEAECEAIELDLGTKEAEHKLGVIRAAVVAERDALQLLGDARHAARQPNQRLQQLPHRSALLQPNRQPSWGCATADSAAPLAGPWHIQLQLQLANL
eukprot:SAG31_NODE_118_length_24006_cov_8.219266_13_plen_110_part_00